jgi:diguanylate cyclase (GGDEF)-like protein
MLFELLARRRQEQGTGDDADRQPSADDLLLSTSDKIDVIQALASYNARRVKQMILAINALIALSIINNIVFDRGLWLSLAAATVFCVLFLARRYYDTDRPSAAQFIFLWTIFGAVSYITWAGDGLRDQIILGNSISLVFAAILATPRHFLVMYVAVVLNTIALGLANELGWVDYSHFAFDWSNVGDAVMLYSVTAVTVFILAYDMRQLLARYNKEYRKAKASEDEIFRLANHDTLTGLPNLFMAEKKYRDEISGRHGPRSSVLMVGLDNFKAVNDSLGHVFGDNVLKMISTRLADVAGDAFLFRVGGDVFGIMSTTATTPEAVEALADSVQKRVSAPLEAGGHVIMLTCSLGASIRLDGAVTFEHLRREADIAMYRAKSVAPNTFKLFDDTMNSKVLASASIAAQLRTALEQGELQLFLQPKIDLETGKVRGAEALLRWFPESGQPPVRPDIFIPVAEDTGMIIEIGAWVIKEACMQCRHMQDLGHKDFSIAVNISAMQFKRGTLEGIVMDAIAESGITPESLELELTESLLLEDEYDIKGQIRRLAAEGVSFSVDDFGKGYSNLGNLGKFDVAVLKIDQSFVFSMFDSAQDLALVEAIVRMAKALGLKIVAEGVETQRAASMLTLFGVDSGQGFYWSKALAMDDFIDYIGACEGGKAKSA